MIIKVKKFRLKAWGQEMARICFTILLTSIPLKKEIPHPLSNRECTDYLVGGRTVYEN